MALWIVVLYILLAVILLIAVTAVAVLLRPSLIIQSMMRYYQWKSGMAIKHVGSESFVFCYGEKGKPNPKKSSILFVHGFTASKDAWIALFRRMPEDLHLIAVDLPGHGGSSEMGPDEVITMDRLVGRVHQFVQLVGLDRKPFHIVGSSLGGTVAGVYSAQHPNLVERVTLTCPAMECPEPSVFSMEVQAILDRGVENMEIHHCSLLPQTPEQAQRMLNLCSYSKIPINTLILKSVVHLREPKNQYFLRLFKGLAANDSLDRLERTAESITMPSQVIWGEKDEVIHVSGAEVLRRKLPRCERVDIIDQCAHSVDLDRPGTFTKLLLMFRKEYRGKIKGE